MSKLPKIVFECEGEHVRYRVRRWNAHSFISQWQWASPLHPHDDQWYRNDLHKTLHAAKRAIAEKENHLACLRQSS